MRWHAKQKSEKPVLIMKCVDMEWSLSKKMIHKAIEAVSEVLEPALRGWLIKTSMNKYMKSST